MLYIYTNPDLLNGTLCLEEDLTSQHLGNDASNRPHIHSSRVVSGAHEYLGSPVVLGHDLLGQRNARVVLLDPRQTKVTYLRNSA